MFEIRLSCPEDAESLSRLKLATFRETFIEGFRIPYPPADLAIFETKSFGLATIEAELADPEITTWVVQNQHGALVGYAKVGPCHLPHPEARPEHGELYQLYLRRSAQGSGLGGELMTRALDHLAATRSGPVWLGVWSGNLKAQAVYARHGFEKVGEYRFPVGSWFDDEFILRRDRHRP